MIAASARAAVQLAREIAQIVPLPPGGRHRDPDMCRAWEELMLDAASGLAASVGYDRRVLDLALGPELEVGVNPPWRVLLILAQLEAEARDELRTAARVSSASGRPRLTGARTSVTALSFDRSFAGARAAAR
jgi:hypothetical protein